MEVFIAGATGVLGRRLVTAFTDKDHEVVGLSRSDEGNGVIESRGGTPRRGDLFDEASVRAAIGDADVAIHAATAIPTTESPSPENWAENDRVRREGTETLTAAAADAGVEQYVQQSITWVAAQPDGSAFDEYSALSESPAVASAIDAERIARAAGDEHGFDVTVLRGGWFTAPDAYDTRSFGEALASGEFVLPEGADDAAFAYLHPDDAASAYVAAVETVAAGDADDGVYHVVDDQPAPVGDYFDAFAERLGAAAPDRLPDDEAVESLGAGSVSFFTSAKPTSSDRFRSATGWEPAYPTYRDALDDVVDSWEADGTLEELPGDAVEGSAAD